MKKLVGFILLVVLVSFQAYACVGPSCNVDSEVRDTNNGSKGDILVYNCEKGNNSVGTWTSPDFLKGEKGDQGPQGLQGLQGLQGEKGDKGDMGLPGLPGLNGSDGKDGIDGLNGVFGKDGLNGENGKDGLNGTDGSNGLNGTNGNDGVNGSNGSNGADGKNGDKGDKGDEGKKGDQGIQGPQGKGLKDRQEAQVEFRILDTRKTTTSVYYIHDFNNDNNTVGIKLTIKIGKSYEERKIEELEKKINNLVK